MKIFLVRHGESALNAQHIHQDSSTGLSELGKTQAQFVAQRFLNIPVDLILSSPFERAKQTAEIISSAVKKDVQYSPLLKEMKRPTEIEGKLSHAPEIIAIKDLIIANYNNPEYRHSDEETFIDFRTRALEALEYIASHTEENILIVTHGEFIRMLVSVMIFGEKLQASEYLSINHFMMLTNTGITVCQYKNSWRLSMWNDVAHLGS